MGKVAHHDLECTTLHADEGARILQGAGGKPVRLLRSHGPVVVGHTLPHACSLMGLAQRLVDAKDPGYRT